MLFPPKESRHSPDITEDFNTNKGFVLGVFRTEQTKEKLSYSTGLGFYLLPSRYTSEKK